MPVQTEPFQLPSAPHALFLAVRSLSLWVSSLLPKMSTSPVRATPLSSTRWLDPRDSSMLPSPLDLAHDCVYLGVAIDMAWARSISPLPWDTAGTVGSFSAGGGGMGLTLSGVRVGR